MVNDNINISSILTHFDSVIRKEVCKRSYAGTLPSTLKEGAMDMVVVKCGNTVRDLNAYGTGVIYIYLYVQPVNGQMNVRALSKMEKSLRKALYEDKFDNENYEASRQVFTSGDGYDTTYKLHFSIKAIRITIK